MPDARCLALCFVELRDRARRAADPRRQGLGVAGATPKFARDPAPGPDGNIYVAVMFGNKIERFDD